MSEANSDLWHWKAVGKLTATGYHAYTIGGEIFPVGPGTLKRVFYEGWDLPTGEAA